MQFLTHRAHAASIGAPAAEGSEPCRCETRPRLVPVRPVGAPAAHVPLEFFVTARGDRCCPGSTRGGTCRSRTRGRPVAPPEHPHHARDGDDEQMHRVARREVAAGGEMAQRGRAIAVRLAGRDGGVVGVGEPESTGPSSRAKGCLICQLSARWRPACRAPGRRHGRIPRRGPPTAPPPNDANGPAKPGEYTLTIVPSNLPKTDVSPGS
jgi:hypothetical protein